MANQKQKKTTTNKWKLFEKSKAQELHRQVALNCSNLNEIKERANATIQCAQAHVHNETGK